MLLKAVATTWIWCALRVSLELYRACRIVADSAKSATASEKHRNPSGHRHFPSPTRRVDQEADARAHQPDQNVMHAKGKSCERLLIRALDDMHRQSAGG